MADRVWTRSPESPRQNLPQIQQHPINITFTALIVTNFPRREPTSRHAILAFMIPILLGFLQIQSMGNDSPGPSKPVTTMASVISIVAYYLAYVASLKSPSYASQFGILMAASGSLSVASLVSLVLPHSWWCIRYILYTLIFLGELHQMVPNLYYSYVRRLYQRPPNIRRPPPILPQTLTDMPLD